MLTQKERSRRIGHWRYDELHLFVIGHCKEAHSIMAEGLAALQQVNDDVCIKE